MPAFPKDDQSKTWRGNSQCNLADIFHSHGPGVPPTGAILAIANIPTTTNIYKLVSFACKSTIGPSTAVYHTHANRSVYGVCLLQKWRVWFRLSISETLPVASVRKGARCVYPPPLRVSHKFPFRAAKDARTAVSLLSTACLPQQSSLYASVRS